jgi:hypothetical protein
VGKTASTRESWLWLRVNVKCEEQVRLVGNFQETAGNGVNSGWPSVAIREIVL